MKDKDIRVTIVQSRTFPLVVTSNLVYLRYMYVRKFQVAQCARVPRPPPPCTDADDLLHYSATVGNIGDKGDPDILT